MPVVIFSGASMVQRISVRVVVVVNFQQGEAEGQCRHQAANYVIRSVSRVMYDEETFWRDHIQEAPKTWTCFHVSGLKPSILSARRLVIQDNGAWKRYLQLIQASHEGGYGLSYKDNCSTCKYKQDFRLFEENVCLFARVDGIFRAGLPLP